MKRLLAFLLVFAAWMPMAAQDPNPQSNFSATLGAASPSLWLNFNDLTTAFKDQISQGAFVNTGSKTTSVTSTVSIGPNCQAGSSSSLTAVSCSLTATAGDTIVVFVFDHRTISSVTDSGGATSVLIANNSPVAYYFANVGAGSHTITINQSSSAYTMLQVIDIAGASQSAPIDTFVFNPQTATTSITSGPLTTTMAGDALVGNTASNVGAQGWTAGTPAFNLIAGPYADFESGTYVAGAVGSYSFNLTASNAPSAGDGGTWLIALKPQVTTTTTTYTSGTVTPRQPGFDNTQINQTSAEFPWNGFAAAPNNTLGSIEWSTPWSMLVHVDRLNWNRTGTLTLASKGDMSSYGIGWALTLGMNGSASQLCFTRQGNAGNGICTGATSDAMPNGFNYDIVVEDSGTGASGLATGVASALSMYINGLSVGLPTASPYINGGPFTNTYAKGFGYVNFAVSGGTGYANTTYFTTTGGGANCVINGGSMTSVSGVPTSFAVTAPPTGNNSGCTSSPTVVLTSPTGTGAVITATPAYTSMNNGSFPLMVPGNVSAGAYYGIAGTTTAQTPTYVDEFAIFPGNLTMTQVQSLFYQTKFYQEVINTAPANRTAFIFDDDGQNDLDDAYALQGAISADRYGYLKIQGVIAEGYAPAPNTWDCSGPVYRQMLDQAGLANIPVGSATTGSLGACGGWGRPANIATYNASTPTLVTDYPSAATVYRTVMAANPTSPVMIFTAGPAAGLAQFMQSPADSISPLTGLQLLAQDAANGGVMYLQGNGCAPSAWPDTLPCTGPGNDNFLGDPVNGAYVLSNHGTMPMVWIGGTPQNSGPGPLYTRTSKDPMFLASTAAGTDVRAGWDSLPMSALISSYFFGGVQIGYTGGTGYANNTYFTSTGGGANCHVEGIMTASGGVPNGIAYLAGVVLTSAYYEGIGSGCTTAPTINLTAPTGTGVTLTAYPTSVCGEYRISGTTGSVTSTTCDNQYFDEMTQWANPLGAPIFQWFLNSIIDPPPNPEPRVQ